MRIIDLSRRFRVSRHNLRFRRRACPELRDQDVDDAPVELLTRAFEQ